MRPRLLWLLLVPAGIALAAAAQRRVDDVAVAELGAGTTVGELDGCEAAFRDAKLTGTFVLYEPTSHRLRGCHLERAMDGYLPASTFKIPNALIGLETVAVRDEHEVMAWDGKARRVASWNRDHDLASAMRDSVLWYYQAMALRIGEPRMRHWIGELGYGNGDIGGGLDRFWLDGRLRISALQQVAFLTRLRDGSLPLSARSQDIVRRILVRDQGEGWVLHGKTGWTDAPDPDTGWFVGWVERDGKAYVYALNADLAQDSDAPKREQVARRLLAGEGLIPAK